MLAGCGSDDEKKPDKKSETKPPHQRVVILKQRFNQLENSLDEMERDLAIQRKRIDSTRETAKAIRRSLTTGNLKGYSIDTVSSDPIVITAMKDQQKKAKNKESKKSDKEETDDRIFDTALILLFLAFIVVLFVVSLKERKKATSAANPTVPHNPDSTSSNADSTTDSTPNTNNYQYGELRRQDDPDAPPALNDELLTPFPDEPDDEEDPRQ